MARPLILILLACLTCGPPLGAEELPLLPADRAALQGLTSCRAVFDIRIGDAKQLLSALKVIEETAVGLRRQQIEPDFVLTFRGSTLPLLACSAAGSTPGEKAVHAEIRERLAEFRSQQVPLEACNMAARIFKVEVADLAPGLSLVGNSIISLIGYQQQGYALVPMY